MTLINNGSKWWIDGTWECCYFAYIRETCSQVEIGLGTKHGWTVTTIRLVVVWPMPCYSISRCFVPVSRIEFVPESSVYCPIIGLGTRECGVEKRCRDPAVQSEFVLRVSRLNTFNWMYCYRELIVSRVVSAIAVFRLVDNNLSSSLHC